MNEVDCLDRFGQFLMAKLRDRAIDHCDGLTTGRWKAPALQQLQVDLARFDEKEKAIVRRCLVASLDSAIHDFLFALQELADFENEVQIRVNGENIAGRSDGLHGELFSDEGWFAKFSKYGKPSDTA